MKFFGNQYRIVGFWKVTAKWTKRILAVSGLITASGWMIYGGMAYEHATAKPRVVEAQVMVEVPVEADSPVLERIMQCESGGKQFNKNGQVLIKTNTNRSYDTGKYQINSIWGAQATKLNLDLTKEKDNEIMARWIYANRGTGDWSASSNCWNK